MNATLNILDSMQAQIALANSVLGTNYATHAAHWMADFGQARQQMAEAKKDHLFLTTQLENSQLLDQIDAEKPAQYDLGSKIFNYPDYLENHALLTSSIKVPVLVISGTTDYAIGVDHYKSFKFPVQLHKPIEGGHLLNYEKNAEFLQALNDFIEFVQEQPH